MRKFVVLALLAVCFTGIGLVFWQQELQYAKPTPAPPLYQRVAFNESISLAGTTLADRQGPLYLHFFNPDCPCSRFNQKHYQSLIRTFKDKLTLYAIVPAYADADRAKQMLGNDVQVIIDTDDKIAKACGTYATPQAVIIDGAHQLYFRGNYNKSRYCTQPETNYAERALTAFVNSEPLPLFDAYATRAYGCELPTESDQPDFWTLN